MLTDTGDPVVTPADLPSLYGNALTTRLVYFDQYRTLMINSLLRRFEVHWAKHRVTDPRAYPERMTPQDWCQALHAYVVSHEGRRNWPESLDKQAF